MYEILSGQTIFVIYILLDNKFVKYANISNVIFCNVLHGNRSRQCARKPLLEKNNSCTTIDRLFCIYSASLAIPILFRKGTKVETDRSIGINSISLYDALILITSICFAFQIVSQTRVTRIRRKYITYDVNFHNTRKTQMCLIFAIKSRHIVRRKRDANGRKFETTGRV